MTFPLILRPQRVGTLIEIVDPVSAATQKPVLPKAESTMSRSQIEQPI